MLPMCLFLCECVLQYSVQLPRGFRLKKFYYLRLQLPNLKICFFTEFFFPKRNFKIWLFFEPIFGMWVIFKRQTEVETMLPMCLFLCECVLQYSVQLPRGFRLKKFYYLRLQLPNLKICFFTEFFFPKRNFKIWLFFEPIFGMWVIFKRQTEVETMLPMCLFLCECVLQYSVQLPRGFRLKKFYYLRLQLPNLKICFFTEFFFPKRNFKIWLFFEPIFGMWVIFKRQTEVETMLPMCLFLCECVLWYFVQLPRGFRLKKFYYLRLQLPNLKICFFTEFFFPKRNFKIWLFFEPIFGMWVIFKRQTEVETMLPMCLFLCECVLWYSVQLPRGFRLKKFYYLRLQLPNLKICFFTEFFFPKRNFKIWLFFEPIFGMWVIFKRQTEVETMLPMCLFLCECVLWYSVQLPRGFRLKKFYYLRLQLPNLKICFFTEFFFPKRNFKIWLFFEPIFGMWVIFKRQTEVETMLPMCFGMCECVL